MPEDSIIANRILMKEIIFYYICLLFSHWLCVLASNPLNQIYTKLYILEYILKRDAFLDASKQNTVFQFQ